MQFIINHWYFIVFVIAVFAIMFTQPTKIKEWLVYATTQAEKELGGGTGQLKLRAVYDMFVTKFPWLSKIIPFSFFSYLVDEALKEMNNMLDTNSAVASYVIGGEKEQGSEV